MWIGGPATSLHSQGGGCSLPGRLLSASVGPQLGGRRRSWGYWVAHSPSMHLLQSKFSIATAVLGFSYMMSDGTLVLKIFWDWGYFVHALSEATRGPRLCCETSPTVFLAKLHTPACSCGPTPCIRGSHKALAFNPSSATYNCATLARYLIFWPQFPQL